MIVLIQYIVDHPAGFFIYQIYFVDSCVGILTGSRKRKNSLNSGESAVSGLEFETYALMQILAADLTRLIDRPERESVAEVWLISRILFQIRGG